MTSSYITTMTPRGVMLSFIFTFWAMYCIVSYVRNAMEARRARREKFDADFAELRADVAGIKASAQATAATLADLRTHFDEVAGKMDKTADRIDAAVTRLTAPVLRVVPSSE
jgi:septal ring factor EnvC (AmiA/AmiB activator)